MTFSCFIPTIDPAYVGIWNTHPGETPRAKARAAHSHCFGPRGYLLLVMNEPKNATGHQPDQRTFWVPNNNLIFFLSIGGVHGFVLVVKVRAYQWPVFFSARHCRY